MKNAIFLGLSFFAGVIEFGFMFFALSNGYGFVLALLFPLAYQTGNLFFVDKDKYLMQGLVFGVAAVLGMTTGAFVGSGIMEGIAFLFSAICLSVSVQVARSVMKGKVATFYKRLAHITGCLASPIVIIPEFHYLTFGVIIVMTSLALFQELLGRKGEFPYDEEGI